MPLILASGSAIRRSMLEAADVAFKVQSSTVDEAAIKLRMASAGANAASIAMELAAAKALDVSRSAGDAWVVGSDSIVRVGDELFDKPRDRGEAALHLRRFSGRTMELFSAVVLAQGDRVEWTHVEPARLKVRNLSDAFIAAYLDAEWPAVAYCVGVFRLEARGVQLFDRIEGDHFSILGMPLLPLLKALRERGLVAS